MAYRNESTDAGRKGGKVNPLTKGGSGTYLMRAISSKGRFLPAYGGGMGKSATAWDADCGTAEDEVGNDFDNDYDDRVS